MPDLSNLQRLLSLLCSAVLIFFGLVWLGRWLKRGKHVKLGLLYHVFALSVAFEIPVYFLYPEFEYRDTLGAVTVLFGAFFIVALLNRYVWEYQFEERRHVVIPKLLRDVVGLLVFLTAIILVIHFIFRLPLPSSVWTGSGIVAIILGLALQDLLGNIIAGLSIHFGKPFRVGDWLIVDTRHAKVTEINWRSTRLCTNDAVYLDIPNRQIAQQTIINLHYPTDLHAMRLIVGIDYSAPPNRVKDALMHATMQAKGVLPQPLPKIYTKNFGESAIEYEIKFWMQDHAIYNDITDAIRTNIWYELQRANIKIPFPTRTLQLERKKSAAETEIQTVARNALRQQAIFQCLDEEHLNPLLSQAPLIPFGRGEKIILQGDEGESMFVLIRGEANVMVNREDGPARVAGLRAGDCFGEMSLLTGEHRSATVIAQTDCQVMEINKAILGDVLKDSPDMLTKLSDLLAKRKLETEGVLASSLQKPQNAEKHQQYATRFLHRLRSFFEL
ncbi:MAG TPA: mechanosensitive ion channel family protein [Verrucomicrobiae bacterium]|nr:mechanosensitive ion channel family protein [Verrucomicrobiae bacterium]